MNTFTKRLQHSGHLIPSALLGYLLAKGLHPETPGFSCIMRGVTGIPCPTCFLTRATCSALTGNIAESVHYHAFGPIAAATLICWAIWSVKAKKLAPNAGWKKPLLFLIPALILYWIARLIATAWWPSIALLHFPK